MDLYPLWNSLRIAGISTVVIFFLGILAAYYIAKTPRLVKGVLDVILTLPLVLPPTVVGYLLLRVLGPKRPVGVWFLHTFGLKLTMTWWSAIFATAVVIFPLMYRTARGAFEQVDPDVVNAARTLGMPEAKVFWRVAMPQAWPGVAAGAVLSFARALGEFGATLMLAGNIAGRTQTIPIAIYFAVQGGKNELALLWMGVIMALSFAVIMVMNALTGGKGGGRA